MEAWADEEPVAAVQPGGTVIPDAPATDPVSQPALPAAMLGFGPDETVVDQVSSLSLCVCLSVCLCVCVYMHTCIHVCVFSTRKTAYVCI